MRISCDLDDTLICYGLNTPCEPRPAWYRRLFTVNEPLRLGARELLRSLQERGWELWVYTTSYRSPRSIKRWFRSHGIRLVEVINQDIHERYIPRPSGVYPPSKNPRAFGIDLHVDDSDGVRQEGETFGFRVVVVTPDDVTWAEKVL